MHDAYKHAMRVAWEVLSEQASDARNTDPRHSFAAFSSVGDSLDLATATRLVELGLVDTKDARAAMRIPDVESGSRDVFYDALHLGLIAPGKLGQAADWSAGQGAYQFTLRGLAFFRKGEVSLSAPGLLIARVREVVSEGHIELGAVPLVEEAQRCWAMGCLRAAMVLIGLASEEVCTGLLDELSSHPSPPQKGEALYSDWEKLNNDALSFYPRWQSGLALIESAKQGLKKTYGGAKPDWWRTWEPLPGAVQPYAEAVRIARNTAAHSVDDIFTAAQVGLLLASLPTMLKAIAELTAFLNTPPAGVALPKLGQA